MQLFRLLKNIILVLMTVCLLLYATCSYASNKFIDCTFTDQELINLTRLIYDTSFPQNEITLTNGELIKRDGKCGLGLLQILEYALQNQTVSPEVIRQIEEIRSTDDLDETYNTANFTIEYNDTPGDPDCVYPDSTHPTVQNIQGEAVPWYIYNLGEYLEQARYIYLLYGFEEPWSVGLMNVNVLDLPEPILGQTGPLSQIDIDNDMIHGPDYPDDWIYKYLSTTATHELFHKVQFEYVDILDEDFWDGWIMEGTTT